MKAITKKTIRIQVGSHIHNPTGGFFVEIPPDQPIELQESVGSSCSVWVKWQGNRGKIECGQISNLTKDERVILV